MIPLGILQQQGGGAATLAFHALTPDPLTYEMKGVLTGTGDLTTTHTSTLYAPDHEDVHREFGEDEPVWSGGRVVRNEYPYSEDLSSGSTTESGITVDSLTTLTFLAQNGFHTRVLQTVSGVKYTFSFRCRNIDGNTNLQMYYNGVPPNATAITVDGTLKRYSAIFTGDGGNGYFGIRDANASGHGQVEVTDFQLEPMAGQSNQNPGEYVPRNTIDENAPELVTNGDFDTDTDWTKGVGCSISGGELHMAGDLGTAATYQAVDLIEGKAYIATHTITASNDTGYARMRVGGTFEAVTTAVGTYTGYFVAGSSDTIQVYCTTDFVGSVDNVSVREATTGLAVFATENGNTVTDNVVTEAVGDPLPSVPYLQCYPAAENSLTYSRDLTQWTQNGTAVSALDAVGLTGEPNTATTLTDDDVSVSETVESNIAIPPDANTHVVRLFVKKDLDETRFPEVYFRLNGSGTSPYPTYATQINTKTGAHAVRTDIGTNRIEVNDLGDWWEWLVENQNDGDETNAQVVIRGAGGVTIGVYDAAATGSIIVGNGELRLDKTLDEVRGLGPIFTTTAAVATDATVYDFDLGNYADTQVWNCEWTPAYPSTASGITSGIISLSFNTYRNGLYNEGSSIRTRDSGLNVSSNAQAFIAGDLLNVGSVNHAGDLLKAVAVDGDWDGSDLGDTYSGSFTINTSIRLGVGAEYPFGISNIQFWNDIASYTDGYNLLNELQGP